VRWSLVGWLASRDSIWVVGTRCRASGPAAAGPYHRGMGHPLQIKLPGPAAQNQVEFARTARYLFLMRRHFILATLGCLLAMPFPAAAATGSVIKVLPLFLDLEGRRAPSPSLYDRDAYQESLRRHPERRSGMSFEIQWKTHGGVYSPLKLRVELRGSAKGDLPSYKVLETEVKPGGWFSHWTSLPLVGEDYREMGTVTAWRVTLWEGDELLGEQKSFLW